MIRPSDPKPPFWLVWRRGGRSPVFEHESYNAASAEAERLSKANPCAAFFVLAPAARRCTGDEVYWSHCDTQGYPDDFNDEHAPPPEEATI